MKVVFITGGSSRIGRAVAEELVSDHRLVFLRNRRPVPAASANCEVLDGGLAAVSRHKQQIRAADVVLHLAAVTHERSEAEYLEVNVKGTRRLLAACRDDQPVVSLSTRCVGPWAHEPCV